jgi:hypothetical protein
MLERIDFPGSILTFRAGGTGAAAIERAAA